MAEKYSLYDWRNYHPRENPNAPIVLCFGDSWFQYFIPGIGNLTNRFYDFGKRVDMDLVALGAVGMEIADPGRGIMSDVETFIKWEKDTLGMILISGGGNDFAGADDLDPLLQRGNNTDVKTWFKAEAVNHLFGEIANGFKRVVALRNALCPLVPIVTHCYDYSHATGQGVLWFSPWIKPSLDKIGMPQNMHDDAIKFIIDRLAAVQEELAGDLYHFVDTRGLLDANDWSNELHPTRNGFNKIARKFYPVFEKYFPTSVRKPSWF
jgi:hypothetical protein